MQYVVYLKYTNKCKEIPSILFLHGCGSRGGVGCPLMTVLVVQSLAPPVIKLKCPWSKH